jgi:hypothetical protein
VLIITSEDGLAYAKGALENMKQGTVYIDSSLPFPDAQARVVQQGFRETAGAKEAAKYSLSYMLEKEGFFGSTPD